MSRLPRWALASLGFALAGLAVAVYLTYTHFNEGALVCGVGDCQTVQGSEFATIAGIPIALLGLGLFGTLVALGVIRTRAPQAAEALTFAAFGFALAGVLYSAYLTYLEVAVIFAICQWCVVSAIATLGVCLAEGTGVARLLTGRDEE
jgi:uncharacterized membrane protein